MLRAAVGPTLEGNDEMRSIVSLASVVVLLIGSASVKADDVATCSKGAGDDTIAACTRAISSGKSKGNNLSIIFTNRGNALHIKGDYDRAIADFTEAIQINPHYAVDHNSRGNAYQIKGNYDRATADYTEAIRIDPKYAVAYNGRGNGHQGKGDYDRAIADYSEAIRLDPRYAVAYNNRGNSYKLKN